MAADELEDFVAHMGCHFQWDVVAIQEGFRTQVGLQTGRTRAAHCTSDDVGKSEMSGNTRTFKVGRSVCVLVGRHKVAHSIIVDEDHNVICTSAALWMQYQRLPRHFVGNTRLLRHRPREEALLGMDCNVGLAGVLDKDFGRHSCGWPNWKRTGN